MTSVPFHCDADSDLAEVDGLLRVEGDALVFEYQKTTLGLFKGEARRVRVPLDDVQEIHHKRRRLLRDKLTLTARRIDAFDRVPGHTGGRLKLLVHHRNRDDLDAFLRDVEEAARTEEPDA